MNDRILTKFILSFLVDKDDYLQLPTTQQQIVYETCRTIMTAIYNAIRFENVYPVIMCGDVEAEKVISKAIKDISILLPSTTKITVTTIH